MATLGIGKAYFCDFVVWSLVELHVDKAMPIPDFQPILSKLRCFYFDHMLPYFGKAALLNIVLCGEVMFSKRMPRVKHSIGIC